MLAALGKQPDREYYAIQEDTAAIVAKKLHMDDTDVIIGINGQPVSHTLDDFSIPEINSDRPIDPDSETNRKARKATALGVEEPWVPLYWYDQVSQPNTRIIIPREPPPERPFTVFGTRTPVVFHDQSPSHHDDPKSPNLCRRDPNDAQNWYYFCRLTRALDRSTPRFTVPVSDMCEPDKTGVHSPLDVGGDISCDQLVEECQQVAASSGSARPGTNNPNNNNANDGNVATCANGDGAQDWVPAESMKRRGQQQNHQTKVELALTNSVRAQQRVGAGSIPLSLMPTPGAAVGEADRASQQQTKPAPPGELGAATSGAVASGQHRPKSLASTQQSATRYISVPPHLRQKLTASSSAGPPPTVLKPGRFHLPVQAYQPVVPAVAPPGMEYVPFVTPLLMPAHQTASISSLSSAPRSVSSQTRSTVFSSPSRAPPPAPSPYNSSSNHYMMLGRAQLGQMVQPVQLSAPPPTSRDQRKLRQQQLQVGVGALQDTQAHLPPAPAPPSPAFAVSHAGDEPRGPRPQQPVISSVVNRSPVSIPTGNQEEN